MDELVVNGAELILAPGAGWSWVRWNGSLKLKVCDRGVEAEDQPVAIAADIVAMHAELGGRSYQAQGFSDKSGTVQSATITVDAGTLSHEVTVDDQPAVVFSTTGQFTVQCAPSLKLPPSAPPVPDPGCAMRTGTWHLSTSGQTKTGGNQGVGLAAGAGDAGEQR